MKCEDFEFKCNLYSEIEWEICNHYNLGDPQSGGLTYKEFIKFGEYFEINLSGRYKSLSARIMICNGNDGGYAVNLIGVDVTQHRRR